MSHCAVSDVARTDGDGVGDDAVHLLLHHHPPTTPRRRRTKLLQNGVGRHRRRAAILTFQLLREQMASLHAAGGLRQHRFGFKASESAKPELYTKPNIFEAELDDAPVAAAAPKLKQTLQTIDLQSAARAAFPSLELLCGADAAAIKLQCNEGGGGSFPHHYDNAGPPSKRRLTCLFYLNPQWKDGDGGELLLSPWLQPPIRIAPSHGRLVLFLSDTVLHRVLPSRAAIRYCFTIWLDGASTNGPAALRLDARKPCDEALLLDPAQRLLCALSTRRSTPNQSATASRRRRGRGTPCSRRTSAMLTA